MKWNSWELTQKRFWNRLTPEFRLMLSSLSGNLVADQLTNPAFNWDLFLRLTVRHGVFPLVSEKLGNLPEALVPESIRRELHNRCRHNVIHSMLLAGETGRIVRILEQNKVNPIVLKGTPLARRLYGEIGYRPSGDIDLLVHPEALEKTEKLLLQNGYHPTQSWTVMTPWRSRFRLNRSHHSGFEHNESRIKLELHWRPGHPGLELPLAETAQRQRIELGSFSLPVLADEPWVMFLVLHGADHGWLCLRWLYDIVKLMQPDSGIDWGRVALLAERLGQDYLLHQALLLANLFFGAAIPDNFVPGIMNDRKARRLARLALEFFQSRADGELLPAKNRYACCSWYLEKYYGLSLREGRGRKGKYILNHFAPTDSDLKLLALPDRLWFFYYFLRPVTWLWGRIGRIKHRIRKH
jgi:hypothetical protein